MKVTKDPAYKCWENMIQRCSNPKSTGYNNYGGRGISVCDRWKEFKNFISDMGPRPSRRYSIERIDSNGNYEPSNCRWATYLEQAHNSKKYPLKTKTIYIEHHRRKWRFSYNRKRYVFDTQEEAFEAKLKLLKGGWV